MGNDEVENFDDETNHDEQRESDQAGQRSSFGAPFLDAKNLYRSAYKSDERRSILSLPAKKGEESATEAASQWEEYQQTHFTWLEFCLHQLWRSELFLRRSKHGLLQAGVLARDSDILPVLLKMIQDALGVADDESESASGTGSGTRQAGEQAYESCREVANSARSWLQNQNLQHNADGAAKPEPTFQKLMKEEPNGKPHRWVSPFARCALLAFFKSRFQSTVFRLHASTMEQNNAGAAKDEHDGAANDGQGAGVDTESNRAVRVSLEGVVLPDSSFFSASPNSVPSSAKTAADDCLQIVWEMITVARSRQDIYDEKTREQSPEAWQKQDHKVPLLLISTVLPREYHFLHSLVSESVLGFAVGAKGLYFWVDLFNIVHDVEHKRSAFAEDESSEVFGESRALIRFEKISAKEATHDRFLLFYGDGVWRADPEGLVRFLRSRTESKQHFRVLRQSVNVFAAFERIILEAAAKSGAPQTLKEAGVGHRKFMEHPLVAGILSLFENQEEAPSWSLSSSSSTSSTLYAVYRKTYSDWYTAWLLSLFGLGGDEVAVKKFYDDRLSRRWPWWATFRKLSARISNWFTGDRAFADMEGGFDTKAEEVGAGINDLSAKAGRTKIEVDTAIEFDASQEPQVARSAVLKVNIQHGSDVALRFQECDEAHRVSEEPKTGADVSSPSTSRPLVSSACGLQEEVRQDVEREPKAVHEPPPPSNYETVQVETIDGDEVVNAIAFLAIQSNDKGRETAQKIQALVKGAMDSLSKVSQDGLEATGGVDGFGELLAKTVDKITDALTSLGGEKAKDFTSPSHEDGIDVAVDSKEME
ncbi:unnamed protein product [Amoebophrya sp. A25]|nr:unnamed protein product [Amoebophrya sp. A25]|eukprot:GSA25T00011085001.1